MKSFSSFLVAMSSLLCTLHVAGCVVCLLAALVFWSRSMLSWAGFCAIAAVVWLVLALVFVRIRSRGGGSGT